MHQADTSWIVGGALRDILMLDIEELGRRCHRVMGWKMEKKALAESPHSLERNDLSIRE